MSREGRTGLLLAMLAAWATGLIPVAAGGTVAVILLLVVISLIRPPRQRGRRRGVPPAVSLKLDVGRVLTLERETFGHAYHCPHHTGLVPLRSPWGEIAWAGTCPECPARPVRSPVRCCCRCCGPPGHTACRCLIRSGSERVMVAMPSIAPASYQSTTVPAWNEQVRCAYLRHWLWRRS